MTWRRDWPSTPPVAATAAMRDIAGRTGVFQIMPVSESIGRIIMEGGNAMQIARQAAAENIRDVRQAGLGKVKRGLISLEELNRITVD